MPAQPLFNPVVLRQLAAELDSRGEDSAHLFRGMGFNADVLDRDPEFLVSYRQISTVLQRALRLVMDDGLGFRLGRRRTAVGTGVAGLGWLTCGTVQEAFLFVEAHSWAFGTPVAVSVSVGADHALTVSVEPRFKESVLGSILVEEFFCAMVSLARGLVGPDFSLNRLELTRACPLHVDELQQFVGGELAFMQRADRMVIGPDAACRVPASKDAVVMREVALILESRLMQHQPSDVCATVEQILRQQLAQPPTLIQLAYMLNTSERTLRRKLDEQHTTYQRLLDKVRREQALMLLQNEGAPLSFVTAALGFSDVRALRRAMKRWTGSAPAASSAEASAWPAS